MISVRFFARLREQLGCESIQVSAQNLDTVGHLYQKLLKDYPHWQPVLEEQALLFAVNRTLAKDQEPVRDGDEVAIMPPVTGG